MTQEEPTTNCETLGYETAQDGGVLSILNQPIGTPIDSSNLCFSLRLDLLNLLHCGRIGHWVLIQPGSTGALPRYPLNHPTCWENRSIGSRAFRQLRDEMELISIVLARVVAFLEVRAIDSSGKTSTLEIFSDIARRYSFSKAPQSIAEIDYEKGVELAIGKLGQINIDRLAMFSNGIIVDTRSSTDDCEKILADLLAWAKQALGAKIEPSRKNFVSQILFRSRLQLTLLNPVLAPIAERLSSFVSGELKQPIKYEPTAILFGADPTLTKLSPVQFTLDRRAETPFFENIYFSNAPLRTAGHIELVSQFEKALIPETPG
jgi:hypothetical protein